MIQAVIFDCFGVLATDGWLPFRDAHFGDKPDLLEQARFNNVLVDQGQMSYHDFMLWLAEVTGVPFDEIRRVIEGNVPNEPLFSYIRDSLAPRYQIGLLSNAGANWLDTLFEPWQVALFDEAVLSYQLGIVKPNPAIYEATATRLGVLPEEAIFIDDRIEFVTGAKAVGMHGVHYKSVDQTTTELEALLRA